MPKSVPKHVVFSWLTGGATDLSTTATQVKAGNVQKAQGKIPITGILIRNNTASTNVLYIGDSVKQEFAIPAATGVGSILPIDDLTKVYVKGSASSTSYSWIAFSDERLYDYTTTSTTTSTSTSSSTSTSTSTSTSSSTSTSTGA